MSEYQNKYLNKQKVSVADFEQIYSNANSWEDLYWLAKIMEDDLSNFSSEDILKVYEKSFSCGLNIYSAQNLFLDASQSVAKLYLKFNRYGDACNMLMVLDANLEDVPDWVHLDYASALLHKPLTFRRLAVEPSVLVTRLKKVKSKSVKTQERCKAIYKEFINICTETISANSNFKYDQAAIIDSANEFDLKDCDELKELTQINNPLPPQVLTISESDYADLAAENSELYEKLLKATELANGIEDDKKQLETILAQQEERIEVLEKRSSEYNILFEENKRIREELKQKDALIAEYQKQAEESKQEIIRTTGNENVIVPNKIRRLLIIGATEVSVEELKKYLSPFGFDKKNSQFITDYDKIKKAAGRIQYQSTYDGIIVGPNPHKTENLDGYNSMLEKLKNEEGFPHVEECRANNSSNELKITKDSFKKALRNMQSHLDSIEA